MKQKSENQKALPKFFKILAVAGLIGGVLGSLSSVAGYFWQEHDLGAAFARMLNAGSLWGMLVCSAVLLGIGLRLYHSARNAFRSWDGEDETVMEQADEQLSWAMMLENLTMIVSFSASLLGRPESRTASCGVWCRCLCCLSQCWRWLSCFSRKR